MHTVDEHDECKRAHFSTRTYLHFLSCTGKDAY